MQSTIVLFFFLENLKRGFPGNYINMFNEDLEHARKMVKKSRKHRAEHPHSTEHKFSAEKEAAADEFSCDGYMPSSAGGGGPRPTPRRLAR